MNEEWEIREKMESACKLLLADIDAGQLSIEDMAFIRLTICEAASMETYFIMEKIYGALKELGKDKALRPNGF